MKGRVTWLLCSASVLGAMGFDEAHGQADALHVDAVALPGGNGSSWTSAFRHLQDALAAAQWSARVSEIRVAQGIYAPDEGWGQTEGDRDAAFRLLNDIAILGGFGGLQAADPDRRDVTAYETILTGDLLRDDGPDFANNAENSHHVVTGDDVGPTAILDGFTVTAGYADAGAYRAARGAGMRNDRGSPTVLRCRFVGNMANNLNEAGGAGVYNDANSAVFIGCSISNNRVIGRPSGGGAWNYNSNAVFRNCMFADNDIEGLGPQAGAVYNIGGDPAFISCTFARNDVAKGPYGSSGGAVVNRVSDASFVNCVFEDNFVDGSGGAVENTDGFPEFVNCLFARNVAKGGGGVLRNIFDGSPVISNCTFVDNRSALGGALYGYSRCYAELTNCVLWGNTPPQIHDSTGTVTEVTYSCIQGGWPGEGNLEDDPLFVASPGADYRLSNHSPCVDAADNGAAPEDAFDLDGDGDTHEPIPRDLGGGDRFVDHPATADTGPGPAPLVDMGAHEFQLAIRAGTFEVVTGTYRSGGLDELLRSDDLYVRVGAMPPATWLSPTVRVDLEARALVERTSWVTIAVESALSNSGGAPRQRISLFDFEAGDWHVVDERPAPADDGVVEHTIDVDADRLVDSRTGSMRMRLEWFELGDAPGPEAEARIDQALWHVHPLIDCNGNGLPDHLDIRGGISPDCNLNAVPDECEPGGLADCNHNQVPDLCDIHAGTSEDCNANAIPDECLLHEHDCNFNGVPDECDIAGPRSEDCNGNGIPDECDLAARTSTDCNANAFPDECETGGLSDCNGNQVPDLCDIHRGTSLDEDFNGVPDECEVGIPCDRTEVTASGEFVGADFGRRVAADGNVAVIASATNDDACEDDQYCESGAVYIYRFDGSTWVETKLLAPNNRRRLRFGYAVAIEGDVLAVVSRADSPGSAVLVYVYDHLRSTWQFDAKLPASNPGEGPIGSISMNADVIIAGRSRDDGNGRDAGAAHVYRFDPRHGQWAREAELLASDGAAEDLFGYAVGVDGDVAVVSAINDEVWGPDSGSAYVFRYHDRSGHWGEQAKLVAPDGREDDVFGVDVDVSGDTIVVGARQSYNGGPGKVYVYRYTDDAAEWTIEAILTASDAQPDAGFGAGVSIRDGIIAAGAPFHDWHTRGGAVYLFEFDAGTSQWTEFAQYVEDTARADLGADVDLAARFVVAGASRYGDSAYIYRFADCTE